jgi:hypothetical protein
MKTKLVIAAGIFAFLGVIALFGFLRLAQRPRSAPQSTETAMAPPPSSKAEAPPLSSTSAREQIEREQLERARMETARQEADKQGAESAMARQQPAPPAAPRVAPGNTPNLNLRSGGGTTAPSPPVVAKPASSLEDVDAALQKLDWGQMAFDVPEKLRLEQTALIHLLISPAHTAEQLTNAIREQTSEPVKIESARIQISGMMEAKLVGSAFEIRPITPEEPQMVSRTEATEWKWEIRPRQSGQQSLHLTLNAIIRFDDKERPRVIRTFDRVIQVDVAASDGTTRWRLPVLVIAGALITVGLGAMLFRLLQNRKRTALTQSRAPASPAGEGGPVDLFLSYSRRDEKRVLPIAGRLRAAGLKVWMDQSGIDGATLWAQEISDAIRRAKVCVLFGSASSFGSPHVIREISLACEERKPILPLQLDPVETPSTMRYQLAGIQHIVLYQGDPEANFQLILRALTRLGAQPANSATE